jgi:hypothetical protein
MERVQDNIVPIPRSNILFRRTPDLAMWVLWLLATTGVGAVWSVAVYSRGFYDEFASYLLAFLGFWLGLLQGLVIRRYVRVKRWWMWIITSGVGWFGAMVILLLATIVGLIGSGLNDADPRGGLVAVCGMAGAVFGAIQCPRSSMFGLDAILWTMANGIAWALGGLVGGIVGLTVYGSIATERYVDFGSIEGSTSIATGLLVAMLVIGVFTGLVLVLFLRQRTTLLSTDAN